MKKQVLTILSILTFTYTFAQVNYTDINPDEVLNATYVGESYSIDFNNDSNIELVIFATKVDTTIAGSFPTTITGVAINTMGNTEIVGQIQTLGTETLLVADTLNSGDVIDGSLNYVNSSSPAIFPGVGLGAKESMLNQYIGQFSDVGMKYFGVKFEVGANVHYGWVRVSLTANCDQLTIDSYGFEATPSAQILAGDMGGGQTVSINENFDNLKLYTFDSQLFIEDNGQAQVEVYNLIGNKMLSFSNNGKSITSIETLPTGIYLVNYTKGNVTQTFKVVK